MEDIIRLLICSIVFVFGAIDNRIDIAVIIIILLKILWLLKDKLV